MPRRKRVGCGGLVYHVLNRSVGRATVFHKDGDYEAFERVLAEAHARLPVRVLTYCLMPNHWHLVLWPAGDGDLSEFMRWLTVTHTQRYRAHYHSSGTGPLYQGRFKSFPVQADSGRGRHVLAVCRYVERNPLRAGLCDRAEGWRWSGLARADRAGGNEPLPWLLSRSAWPADVPPDWPAWVNAGGTEAERAAAAAELLAIRACARRETPLGDEPWVRRTAEALGLLATLRPPGRPKKRGAAAVEAVP